MVEQEIPLDVRIEQMVGAETAESFRSAAKRWEKIPFNRDMLFNQVTEALDRGGEQTELKKHLDGLLLVHNRG